MNLARPFAMLVLAALAMPALAASSADAQGALTKKQVGAVVAAMEDAARHRDPRTVASFMSDDCVITTSFPGKDGSKKVTHKDKDTFVADEISANAKQSNTEYDNSAPSIDIEAGGKIGKASYKVRQTYTEEGRKVQIVAYEIATVQMRDGAPAITAMDVDAIAMSIDDRRIF